MGWLKQRIERERFIQSQIPFLWKRLVESMSQAVADWANEGPGDVTFSRVDGTDIKLMRHCADQSQEPERILVSFDPGEPCVTCESRPGSTWAHLGFSVNDQGSVCFAMEGKPIEVETACRLLTESIFH